MINKCVYCKCNYAMVDCNYYYLCTKCGRTKLKKGIKPWLTRAMMHILWGKKDEE